MLEAIYNFDLSVFNAVFSIGNDVLDVIMNAITTLGDGWIMPVFAAILLIFKKTRKAGMMMLGALLVMLILNNEILKPLIARVRPCYLFDLKALEDHMEHFIKVVDGEEVLKSSYYTIIEKVNAMAAEYPELAERWVNVYEWPGVASHMPSSWSFPSGHTSSSFAFATAVAANNKKLGVAAYVLAALIGFSRIYLGVHYFTDVLAGAVLGVVYGIVGVLIVKAIVKAIVKKNAKAENWF